MFKKLLTAIVLISGMAFSSKAQDFHAYANPLDSATAGSADLVIYNYLINDQAADSIAVNWQIVSISMPDTSWHLTGFCDNNNCFYDTAILHGSVARNSFKFAAGKSCDLYPHFKVPAATAGAGEGILKVRVVSSLNSQVDTITYTINKNGVPTAITTINNNDKRVVLSPNPASTVLNLFTEKSLNAAKVSFINIAGQVVLTKEISKSSETNSVNVNGLANGTYMVNVADKNGKIITVRKFVKG